MDSFIACVGGCMFVDFRITTPQAIEVVGQLYGPIILQLCSSLKPSVGCFIMVMGN